MLPMYRMCNEISRRSGSHVRYRQTSCIRCFFRRRRCHELSFSEFGVRNHDNRTQHVEIGGVLQVRSVARLSIKIGLQLKKKLLNIRFSRSSWRSQSIGPPDAPREPVLLAAFSALRLAGRLVLCAPPGLLLLLLALDRPAPAVAAGCPPPFRPVPLGRLAL